MNCWLRLRKHNWGPWVRTAIMFAIGDSLGYIEGTKTCKVCGATRIKDLS